MNIVRYILEVLLDAAAILAAYIVLLAIHCAI